MGSDATFTGEPRLPFLPADILPPVWLGRNAEEVARGLLGCYLVSTLGDALTAGRIVETEAYLGVEDPASHAAVRAGRTSRNAPMFGPPGSAYIYLVYGIHWCLNVVTGAFGDPQAVLLRAIEPSRGHETMRERRGRDHDLANGPARLSEALGVDGSLNRHSLSENPLLLMRGEHPNQDSIGVSGRIGVRHAHDWPLRFFLRGHPDVSRGKAAASAPRGLLP